MDFFINIFNVLLYQPFLNALIFLYQYLPGGDFGVAVIALTLIIRLVLYPLMMQSIRAQKALSELQPKIQEIQQRNKDNKEKQAKEMMALYQKEKVNPFGGCLPLLLQLPILFTLYYVFLNGLKPEAMQHLYAFMPNPGQINPVFLNLIDLAQPSVLLAVLAGISQFVQSKMLSVTNKVSQAKNDQMAMVSSMMQKQMLYFFPIFTVIILWQLPSALGLYWFVGNLFTILQQYLIMKPQAKAIVK